MRIFAVRSKTRWDHIPSTRNETRIGLTIAAAGLVALGLMTSVANATLVGHWKFDNESNVGEATVSTNLQASGAGAGYTASGRIGGALSLNGTAYLRVDAAHTLAAGLPTGDASYTLAAFVQTSSPAPDGIIGWGAYGSPSQVNAFRTGPELTGETLWNYGWGPAADYPAAAPGIFDGTWHHVAATYDSATSRKRLYFDGAEIGAGKVLAVDLAVTAENFRIGSTLLGEKLTGQLDDVRVYDTALGAREIGALSAAVGTANTDITRPGDPIALVNGVNDGDGNDGPPPFPEGVENAINDIGQKYLNFLDLGSGFAVTPSGPGREEPVTALTFYTANDAEPRDPASYRFSGSNGDLVNGPWTAISSGPLALPSDRNAGGSAIVIPPSGNHTAFRQQVTFRNTKVYTHYQIIFPTLKDAAGANSMSIGEVELQVMVTVIAFEGLAPPGGEVFSNPYAESGFDFSTVDINGGFRLLSGTFPNAGLTMPTGDYGFAQNSDNPITIEGPAPFSLLSLDMAMLFSSEDGSVDVVGNLARGGTVGVTLAVPAIGNNGGALANFSFDKTWTKLTSVTITRTSGNFLGIDNVTIKFPGPVHTMEWLPLLLDD